MQYQAWLLKVCGLVLGIVVATLVTNTTVSAAATEVWQSGVSLVSRSERGYVHDGIICGGTKTTIDVIGNGIYSNACVFGDASSLRLAWFSTGTAFLYAIAFPGVSSFYELRGVCANHSCVYAAVSDVYITTMAYDSTHAGAVAYKQFSRHVVKRFDIAKGSPYYEFQSPQPDYSMKAGDTWLPTGKMSISSNGEWALIELKGYGLLRMNTKTFDTRRFMAPSAAYGSGSNPAYEMTITNDGTLAVATGQNAGLVAISIDETCGDRLVAGTQKYYQPTIIHCKTLPLSLDRYVTSVRHGASPWFSASGDHLGITFVYTDGTSERLMLAAQDASVDVTLPYLALGDSFTSGEGETDIAKYRLLSDTTLTPCHVSWRSYPFLLGSLWNLQAESVACSGARTVDIYGRGRYRGQAQSLQQLSIAEYIHLKERAIDSFRSGIALQNEFVVAHQPAVVSLSIGGNDAGLIAKLKACLSPGTCEWALDPQKRYATAKEIANVQIKIIETIKRIRQVSPGSKIILVGYPQIINTDTNTHCGAIVNVLLSRDERIFIRESITYLNKILHSAATATSIDFAEVETAFKGHELCGTTDTAAMNSLRLGNDIAPVDLLPAVRVFGAESFHPTPLGHRLIADAIYAQYPSSVTVAHCLIRCDQPATTPPLSSYWQPQPAPLYTARQQSDEYIVPESLFRGDVVSIDLPPLTFAPHTTVQVELHSQPMALAALTVDQDGVLRGDISIPRSAPLGYHSMHIIGSAPDGEQLDLYDSVMVADSSQPSIGKVEEASRQVDIRPTLRPSAGSKHVTNLSRENSEVLGKVAAIHPRAPTPSIAVPNTDPVYYVVIITTSIVGLTGVLVAVVCLRRRKQVIGSRKQQSKV